MSLRLIPHAPILSIPPRALILCAILAVVGASEPAPARAQDTQWTAALHSPRQTVDVQDDSGRLRRARFEASAQTHADGTARGSAFLLQGNEKLEFRFERVTSLVVENGAVRQLVMEGRGIKTSGRQA